MSCGSAGNCSAGLAHRHDELGIAPDRLPVSYGALVSGRAGQLRRHGWKAPLGRLVLQRHLGELVATAPVVTEPGLVLASPPPGRPGPDVLGIGCAGLDQVDQQPADLR